MSLTSEQIRDTFDRCVQGVYPERDPQPCVILAASPVVKQPSSMPYRIVIARLRNFELVVWDQTFDEEQFPVKLVHAGFLHGDYFTLTKLTDAMKRFAERCERFAKHCDTIWRNE